MKHGFRRKVSFFKSKQAILETLNGIVDSIPSLVVALFVLLFGWLLARLARRAVRHLSSTANRFLERAFRRGSAASVRLSLAFITVTGELAFWIVLIFAIVLAAGAVGVGSVGQWLNQIVIHLPNLLVGAAIVVVGYFFSVYLRELVTSSAESGRIGAASAVGRLVQITTLTLAVIIGLDQAGVDVTILIIAFAVVGGGLITGLAVAFGVGARDYAANLIGGRNARHLVQPGMRLRVDDLEGDVLEVSPTHIALETAEGKTLLPAQMLETRRVVIITPTADRPAGDG